MVKTLTIKIQRALKGTLGPRDSAWCAPPALVGEVRLQPLMVEVCSGLPRAELNHSHPKSNMPGHRNLILHKQRWRPALAA